MSYARWNCEGCGPWYAFGTGTDEHRSLLAMFHEQEDHWQEFTPEQAGQALVDGIETIRPRFKVELSGDDLLIAERCFREYLADEVSQL